MVTMISPQNINGPKPRPSPVAGGRPRPDDGGGTTRPSTPPGRPHQQNDPAAQDQGLDFTGIMHTQ